MLCSYIPKLLHALGLSWVYASLEYILKKQEEKKKLYERFEMI